MKFCYVICSVFPAFNCIDAFSQVSPMGAKPMISVNGMICAIQNQQFSCTMRVCQEIVIYEGDSVEFCTNDNIDLSTDTAYYMIWDFAGSANYPSLILNTVPYTLPACYTPVWNTAGTYTVDILYNGWLSAYPGRDCYGYGPSHWSVPVTVLGANGIQVIPAQASFQIGAGPAPGEIFVSSNTNQLYLLRISDLTGQKITELYFKGQSTIGLYPRARGVYLAEIFGKDSLRHYVSKVVIQ